jgi:hypothetical protein
MKLNLSKLPPFEKFANPDEDRSMLSTQAASTTMSPSPMKVSSQHNNCHELKFVDSVEKVVCTCCG